MHPPGDSCAGCEWLTWPAHRSGSARSDRGRYQGREAAGRLANSGSYCAGLAVGGSPAGLAVLSLSLGATG